MNFEIITSIPLNLQPDSFDNAINNFIEESDQYKVPHNKTGTKQGLLDIIASCLIFKNNPTNFIWAAIENGEIKAFAITSISKDIDNSLTYYGKDAWVSKEYRGTKFAKECFQKLRQHAQQLMCKHFVVISSRHPGAYLRFLGKKFHVYATLLKEDL